MGATNDRSQFRLTTVFVHVEDHLATLAEQQHDLVELVTWDDAKWHERASRLALEKGWDYRRAASSSDALAAATGDFAIEWNVYKASDDALASLVVALTAHPRSRGALTANFDPAILWWTDELTRSTGRVGLVQAAGMALDSGSAVLGPTT